jgi:hypothetical protein
MWKTHFIVVSKRDVFHSPCGKHCGKLSASVENSAPHKVFHISTGTILRGPVEMWKTQG